jgi:hypothetical protein
VWLSPPPDARDAGVQQAGRKTIAWIVGSVGAVITASVLFSGYGVLALGVGLIASVVAVRAMIGADDPSLRLLRVLVPLLLLGGAIFCATATKTYQPDPFGLAVGSDVHVHCGSVLRPRDDDYGCENWRNARAVEAKWLLVLAVVVAAAAAIDWLIARHRSRNAPANQDDPR